LISLALVTCNVSPKNKKNCFVEIEVEYAEEHNYLFDQFAEMFDEPEKEPESGINNEEEEEFDEEYEDEDDYAKVEQLIPSKFKNNCAMESVKPSNSLIVHFKKLCKDI
jgi:hypothetical protein